MDAPPPALPPGLTPEQLESLRTIGLTLDRAGALWHRGARIEHPRLRLALLRWLDVRDDGRDVVRLDDVRYAYVEVEDAHLRARSARWDGDRCLVLWDDDHEEELAYGSLHQAADHALYASVRGRLRGRIAGPAYHAIAARVAEDGERFVLAARGGAWPIVAAG